MKASKTMKQATCSDTQEEIRGYTLKCPGCGDYHVYDSRWEFNGDFEKPTFTPSYLVKSGHYADRHTDECWCKYNEKHGLHGDIFKCYVCHSFVSDGKIQFLDDCTHHLKGQTVDLPDWSEA